MDDDDSLGEAFSDLIGIGPSITVAEEDRAL